MPWANLKDGEYLNSIHTVDFEGFATILLQIHMSSGFALYPTYELSFRSRQSLSILIKSVAKHKCRVRWFPLQSFKRYCRYGDRANL